MAEEFKVIETQEEFDKAIQKRIARAEREAEEKYKDYLSPEQVETLKKELTEKVQKAEADLKAANEKIAGNDQIVSDLTNRATTAESKLLKSRVAHEKGIPYELADRLVGTTEEELKADAEKLAPFMTPKSAPPLRTTDAGGTGNMAQADMANMLSQLNQQLSGGL